MIINKVILHNFQLFKTAEYTLKNINAFGGTNNDNQSCSSNGCGKSTLAKNAITFVLYGEVFGLNLEKLVSANEKEAMVEIYLSQGSNKYHIIRKIPTSLQIFVNEIEQEFNTNTLAQNFINDKFGNYDYFKKYRMIDLKGINLLDSLGDSRSVISLKKELMTFIDDEFIEHRKSLLQKKLDRETYSVEKKLYKFYLSEKRLETLITGEKKLQQEVVNQTQKINQQQKAVNNLSTEIHNLESDSQLLFESVQKNKQGIKDGELYIVQWKNEIEQSKNISIPKEITIVDYSSKIEKIEQEINNLDTNLNLIDELLNKQQGELNKLALNTHDIDSDIQKNLDKIEELKNKIKGVEGAVVNTRCDECGSFISAEEKEKYSIEKKKEITNLEETNEMLEVHKSALLEEYHTTNEEILKSNTDKSILENKTKILREEIKNLNNKDKEQTEQLHNIEQAKEELKSTEKRCEEKIKLISKQIEEINVLVTEANKKISDQEEKIKFKKEHLELGEDLLNSLQEDKVILENKIKKVQSCILKLQEAFKFKEYRYNKQDILLYEEAIKTLDEFSGWYINEWLGQLSLIVNSLLASVNLSVEFTSEKEFMKIKDNNKKLTFMQLSSGQQIFLSAVFKLAILLHRGDNSGIIICDEGFSSLDETNLQNFIEVCKTTNFQFIIVYQDIPELNEINKIEVERTNNESKII